LESPNIKWRNGWFRAQALFQETSILIYIDLAGGWVPRGILGIQQESRFSPLVDAEGSPFFTTNR